MKIRSGREYSAFEPTKKMSDLERKFWLDYESRPAVYQRIFAMVKEQADLGWTKWSINAAFETARYLESHTANPVDDIYFLNNNHRAYAARLFKHRYPAYSYMLETREQQQ